MIKYLIKGKLFEPIKCGDVGDFFEGCNTTCTDCGTLFGNRHKTGCDCERCPNCGLQILGCDCEPERKFVAEVGDGLTCYYGTDAYPYEIVKVISQTHLVIRKMEAELVEGSSLLIDQKYTYSSNPLAQEIRIKRYQNGWFQTRFNSHNHEVKNAYQKMNIWFGEAFKYLDPTF